MFALNTNRLILRDFWPGDFEAFFAVTQAPAYQKFYPVQETSRDFLQTVFERILAFSQQPNRTKYQVAICLADGELIGTCGVRLEDLDHRQASFGCAIGSKYWGKGYAYEASSYLLNFGFSSLPIYRVYAETNSENKLARALAERLGMRQEGEFIAQKYFRDRWWNTSVYAVLKPEWVFNQPRNL
jgi:[ribosomal protein S5]-alanine N-acetyltransferase